MATGAHVATNQLASLRRLNWLVKPPHNTRKVTGSLSWRITQHVGRWCCGCGYGAEFGHAISLKRLIYLLCFVTLVTGALCWLVSFDASSLHIISLSLFAIALLSATAACCSRHNLVTIGVLAALALLLMCVLAATALQASPATGQGLRRVFEEELEKCNGAIYSTQRVREECLRMLDWNTCGPDEIDGYILLCEDERGRAPAELFRHYSTSTAASWGNNFGGFITNNCLAHQWDNMGTACQRARIDTSWWPSPPLYAGGPLQATAASEPEQTVLAQLGRGDVPVSAKMLFCLCQSSPEYIKWVEGYHKWLNIISTIILFVCIFATITFCGFCCVERKGGVPWLRVTDAYYDPDLL
mmetsp:Transcript_41164/g.68450  ORF Transcript_41164/g.68450 Transcript_41164/m.68450 type:complete len:356 (-) Transcript_41164:24-1091(-)